MVKLPERRVAALEPVPGMDPGPEAKGMVYSLQKRGGASRPILHSKSSPAPPGFLPV